MTASTIAILVTIAAVILFATEIIPLSATAISACIVLAATGVIDWTSAFSGFSASVPLIMIGGSIVAAGLQHTGAAEAFGKIVLKIGGTNQRWFTVIVFAITAAMSSVMSNVATVAIMLPVVGAACYASHGKLHIRHTYMSIGIAACMGGSLTLIGAPTNLLGSGFLESAGVEPLSMFSFTPLGIIRVVVCLIFYATIGYTLQEKFFDLSSDSTSAAEDKESEQKTPKQIAKMWISFGILILMIVGFVAKIWNTQAVAMACGMLTIITGCIPIDTAFKKLPWNVIWVVAGASGLAAGMSKSGAGELIATTVIGWLGGSPSLIGMLIAFTLLTFVMCNIMSATGLVSILCPIAIIMFQKLGYNPQHVVLVICTALNMACVVPYATSPITMTMEGGYRFNDYVKVGGVIAVICVIVQIASYPFLFGA